jgi:hypothetical protein
MNAIDIWLQFIQEWNTSNQNKIYFISAKWSGEQTNVVEQLKKIALTFRKDVRVKGTQNAIIIEVI